MHPLSDNFGSRYLIDVNLLFYHINYRIMFFFIIPVPLAVPHLAVEDIEIDGMTIPKNAVIFPSLMSVHRDPSLWDEPDVFRPERFLNNDKFVKKEGFSAFSMGKFAYV